MSKSKLLTPISFLPPLQTYTDVPKTLSPLLQIALILSYTPSRLHYPYPLLQRLQTALYPVYHLRVTAPHQTLHQLLHQIIYTHPLQHPLHLHTALPLYHLPRFLRNYFILSCLTVYPTFHTYSSFPANISTTPLKINTKHFSQKNTKHPALKGTPQPKPPTPQRKPKPKTNPSLQKSPKKYFAQLSKANESKHPRPCLPTTPRPIPTLTPQDNHNAAITHSLRIDLSNFNSNYLTGVTIYPTPFHALISPVFRSSPFRPTLRTSPTSPGADTTSARIRIRIRTHARTQQTYTI